MKIQNNSYATVASVQQQAAQRKVTAPVKRDGVSFKNAEDIAAFGIMATLVIVTPLSWGYRLYDNLSGNADNRHAQKYESRLTGLASDLVQKGQKEVPPDVLERAVKSYNVFSQKGPNLNTSIVKLTTDFNEGLDRYAKSLVAHQKKVAVKMQDCNNLNLSDYINHCLRQVKEFAQAEKPPIKDALAGFIKKYPAIR